MQPLSLQPGGPRRDTRHKVRIVKSNRFSYAAAAGALLLIIGAGAFPVVWYLRNPTTDGPTPTPETRTWTWKCDQGHTFQAIFRGVTAHCLECGKSAYPVGWYTCPVHGSYEVAAQFSIGDDGKPVTAKVRLTGRPWINENELACPHCGRRLLYKGRDPLERAIRTAPGDDG